MNTVFGRIEEIMGDKGLSFADVARICSVTRACVYQWRQEERKPGIQFIRRLAEATGYSPWWIISGEGFAKGGEYVAVKHAKFGLAANKSGFSLEPDDGGDVFFKRDWFAQHGYSPGELVTINAHGADMEPGICEGDTVIVNTAQQDLKDGRVFAVNYEGSLVLRRLVRDDGEWWLSADNPDEKRYPRKRFPETAFAIGEVVCKQSERI